MRSVKLKMAALMFVIIIPLAASTGMANYSYASWLITSEVESSLERLALESADFVALKLSDGLELLESIASLEDIRSMDWAAQRAALARLPAKRDMLEIAIVDADGVASYLDGTRLRLSDRPYIRSALAGDQNFSEPLVSRKSGRLVIMAAVPIGSGDGIRGAVIARIDSSFLSKLIAEKGYGKRGYAYILNLEGEYIASPTEGLVGSRASALEPARSGDDGGYAAFLQASFGERSGTGSYGSDDGFVYTGFARVPRTDWVIYVGALRDEVLARLGAFKRFYSIGALLVVALSCLAAYALADRFSRPVIELESLFDRAAGGDLTIRAVPRSKDELGRAAESLNRMMDSIKQLSYYDPLTRLPNIGVYSSDVSARLEGRDPSAPLSVALISADRFRVVNEIEGYPAGDALLVEAARRLQARAPRGASAYRGKGDEFILVFDETHTPERAAEATRAIAGALSDPYRVGPEESGRSIRITFSAGLAYHSAHGRSAYELLQSATFAENYAKDSGGDRFRVYEPDLHQRNRVLRDLEQRLPRAMEAGELYLEYQPMIDLATERTAELEALVRWRHPEEGLISPELFIAAAEKTGVILVIGAWILEGVCAQMGLWRSRGLPEIPVSVNISAKEFESPEFIPSLRAALRRHRISPALLQLEITERTVIERVNESIPRLQELRDMGVRISIDDFGIGYSSLSYLVRLPVDTLKIDKTFIQNLESGRQEKAIVSAIIAMGTSLGLTIVTEGIETAEQLEWLRRFPCRLGQGYLFSRPQRGDHPELLARIAGASAPTDLATVG